MPDETGRPAMPDETPQSPQLYSAALEVLRFLIDRHNFNVSQSMTCLVCALAEGLAYSLQDETKVDELVDVLTVEIKTLVRDRLAARQTPAPVSTPATKVH